MSILEPSNAPADELIEISDDRRLPIFIHSELDDLGLTLWAFRVYCHLARRENRQSRDAWPSYSSIARACLQSSYPNAKPETLRRRAIDAVQELVDRGLVRKATTRNPDGSPGHNHYTLTDPKEWAEGGSAYALRSAYGAAYGAATQGTSTPKTKTGVVVGVLQTPQTEGRFPSTHAAIDDAADDAANAPSLAATNADLPATTTETTTTTTTNDDTSSAPQLPPAIAHAWLDTFGEKTPEQHKFLTNRIKGDGADLVLRAIVEAQCNIEAGATVQKPAAYVKGILTNLNNKIGAGQPLPEPKATGHRGYNPRQGRSQRQSKVQASMDAVDQVMDMLAADQVATPLEDEQPASAAPDGLTTYLIDTGQRSAADYNSASATAEGDSGPDDQERQDELKRRKAEDKAEEEAQRAQRAADRAAAEDEARKKKDQAEIDQERKREKDRAAAAAEAAARTLQDATKRIVGATGLAAAQAERIAEDFLSQETREYFREGLLVRLAQERTKAGKPLTTAEATAILHRRLLATPAAAQNRVTA